MIFLSFLKKKFTHKESEYIHKMIWDSLYKVRAWMKMMGVPVHIRRELWLFMAEKEKDD